MDNYNQCQFELIWLSNPYALAFVPKIEFLQKCNKLFNTILFLIAKKRNTSRNQCNIIFICTYLIILIQSFFMKNWHIKSQVMLLQVIASLFVAILVSIYLLLIWNILITQQQEKSKTILYSQLEMLTSFSLNLYKKSIMQVNYQSQQSIRSIQDIYSLLLRYNIQVKEYSGICKYFSKETHQFCYLVPNGSSNTNITTYFSTTNLLESIKFQIPVEKLYFVSSQSDQYFSIYPTFVLVNYFPQSRPWYQNHQKYKNNNIYILSDPYISMFSGVMFTETTTLKDLDQRQKGVIGHDYNMSSFSVFDMEIEGMRISLIDRVGRLLISSYYKNYSMDFKFIQNESLTGLGDSDFQLILNYTDNNPYTTQCLTQLQQTLCIETHQEIQNQLIRTTNIENHILILQIDESAFLQPLNQLLVEFSDNIKEQIFFFIYFGLGTIVLIIISNCVTQCMISSPLERFKNLVKYQSTQTTNQKQLIKHYKKQHISWIEQLEQQVLDMYNLQTTKKKHNKVLFGIQQIQYPYVFWKSSRLSLWLRFIENHKIQFNLNLVKAFYVPKQITQLRKTRVF